MTENESLTILKRVKEYYSDQTPHGNALLVAIKALEDIQQYRLISTAYDLEKLRKSNLTGLELAIIATSLKRLKNYEAIGTVEECRGSSRKTDSENSRCIWRWV